ncbi:hypothetical protein KFL_013790010, partial [Klebsormidium nitens]
PTKQKSEVAKVTWHMVNRLELQSGKKLKSVRTDRGEKYVNKALEDVRFREQGDACPRARAVEEWYRANLAAERKAGKHPKKTWKHPKPLTYQKTVEGEESELWRKSMDEEIRTLLENGTWELVEKPEGVKAVPMKWVYKIKRDALGNVERYKSRSVAKGYLQKQGIDFEEVYAPAPRAWHMRLKEELGNFEFVASMADAALFMEVVAGERVYLVVWVDDILVAARGADRIAKVKAHLGKKFDVRDWGKAKYFLGMELTRNREARTLKLIQKKLKGELVGRYGLASAWARSVPLETGDKSTKEGEPLETKRFPNSECVGSLLYLSVCTRPDIAQAVGALARFMAGPTEEQWRAALGVVRYLAGTAEDGVTFGGSGAERLSSLIATRIMRVTCCTV